MQEVLHTFSAHAMFKLWWYRVSHAQLLFRGHKGLVSLDPQMFERTDVLFKGVQALAIQRTNLYGDIRIIRIQQPHEYTQQTGFHPDALKHAKLFALDSDEGRSWIAAVAVHVAQDIGPLFGPTSWEREQRERWGQENSEDES